MTDPYPYSVEAAAHLRAVVGLCAALGVPWTALDNVQLFGQVWPDVDDLLDLADEAADHDERLADRIEALSSWREMRGYVRALWQSGAGKSVLPALGGAVAARAFGLGVARVEVHQLGWRPVEAGGEAAVVLAIAAPGPGGISHCADMLALRPDRPAVSRDGVTRTGLVGAEAAYLDGPLPGPEIRLFVSPQAWLADWERCVADRPPAECVRPGGHAYLALGDLAGLDWEQALRAVERAVCPERDFAEWLHGHLRRPRPKRHLPQVLGPKKREGAHAEV